MPRSLQRTTIQLVSGILVLVFFSLAVLKQLLELQMPSRKAPKASSRTTSFGVEVPSRDAPVLSHWAGLRP